MGLYFAIGILILPAVIYYIVREAVREGMVEALTEYDRRRKEQQGNL